MIRVDSMASGHFFGHRGAFDTATRVALASADAPQIEVADGVEHAPTRRRTKAPCLFVCAATASIPGVIARSNF